MNRVMKREFSDYLDDMLEYAMLAHGFAESLTAKQFRNDPKTWLATARAIEIVGESVRQIPDWFRRQHPDIPWRKLSGARNVLAHHYDGSDADLIYVTAKDELPDIIAALPAVIAEAAKLK